MAQIAGLAVLLVLAAVLAALFTTRQVEEPIRFPSWSVTVARRESSLSAQLLALQEEERRRSLVSCTIRRRSILWR